MKWPSLRDLGILLIVLILVAGFVGGLGMAFYTMHWPWLVLCVICWILLGAG